MITRIAIPVILAILIASAYIDIHFMQRLRKKTLWKRLLAFMPALLIIAYTVVLALQRDFAPHNSFALNAYLLLLSLVVVPQTVFTICSFFGLLAQRMCRQRRNYGDYVGATLVIVLWYVTIYGTTAGFNKLRVRHIDYYSADLPTAFDGYRMVQFSDAHVGTYNGGREQILRNAVDSINAQHADAVMFVGDLQNMEPQELLPHLSALGSIRAADGVFSVLGNHDYAVYIEADAATKARNCQEMVAKQRQMGWCLLRNEHRTLHRGNDSIVIAGMENDGESKRAPKLGNVGKTLRGVQKGAFVVMLQHDPTCWRRKIVPQCDAQLTLSGHTHAMQFELFGWSPASFVYKEWGGVYTQGGRTLNVSTGLGGFVPFRFGVPGEIVVITLHKK